MKKENNKYGLPPLVGESPKVLILGSMPGDESLRQGRYYSNPSNAFWKIIDAVFPRKTESERQMTNEDYLTSKGIALWDAVNNGLREGSADSGFSEYAYNDIKTFLQKNPTIQYVVLNGKSEKCKRKFFKNIYKIIPNSKIKPLISTSSNTRRFSFEDKYREWSILKILCAI